MTKLIYTLSKTLRMAVQLLDYKQFTPPPYKLIFSGVYPALVAIMLGVSCMEAQVIIGGDDSAAGSLLSLNSDMRGGLQLSNVELEELTEIPESFPGITSVNKNEPTTKDAFKGAMVYNTNILAGQGEGIYTWNGEKWDYVNDNTRYFAVPDYDNGTSVTPDANTSIWTWKALESGFVVCSWESTAGSNDTGVKIDGVRVIGSDYANTGSTQEAMVPIAAGQVLTIEPNSGVVGAKFYPPIFVQRRASDINEEIKTNDVWVDNKPIYKKVVYSQGATYVGGAQGTYPNFITNVFPNSGADIDKVLKVEGYCYPSFNDAHIGFTGSWTNHSHSWVLGLYYVKDTNSITMNKGSATAASTTLTDLTITLYYTKN